MRPQPPIPENLPPGEVPSGDLPDDETERRFYRAVLHELIDMGMDLARAAHKEAAAQPTPAPETVASFDRLARGVRRTVLLARKLGEAPARTTRTQARTELIRRVEDRIQSRHDGPRAESMRAEFAERLDAPDMDDALLRRPVADIIEEICRDLGLETFLGSHAYQRRTPGDVARLLARAARRPPRHPAPVPHPRLE